MKNHSSTDASDRRDADTHDNPDPTPVCKKGRLFSHMNGSAVILVGACLLGTIPLFARPLHGEGIPTAVISAVRMGFSWFLAMSMVGWSRMNLLACDKEERNALLVLGTIGSGLTSVFYTASLKYTTIAIAIVVVFCAVPITTYVIDRVYRRFRSMHLLCLGLVILGFAALSWDKFLLGGSRKISEHLLGILLGVLTGICFGTYAPFGKKLIALKTPVILFWAFGIGFLCHFPLLWCMQGHCPPWTRSTVLNLVGLGLFGCFLPYLLIQIGMKSNSISVMQVSMLFLLEPVISVIVGCHFCEYLSVLNMLGVALVLVSIFIYQFQEKKECVR
ncbi:MAG: DMT family transporter [Candidatus Peribacteraceae bacterium]